MKNTKKIISITLLLSLMLTLFLPLTVSAEESKIYTDVLEDLEKDPNFNSADYPSVPGNRSVQVMHIAEGVNDELFIYVYQPGNDTKDYKAKYINMSLQPSSDRDPTYKLYSLTWLNSNGVFDKYLVDDFTVTDEIYRYYNIATVYRPYDSSVDVSSEAIDGVRYKGYEVGQSWCAYYSGNNLVYEMEKVDVVDIDFKASGSIRYDDGFALHQDKSDSHYIAFSIGNYNVEKIYDADITYTTADYVYTLDLLTGEGITALLPGSEKTVSTKLTYLDTASNQGDALFPVTYTWKRIQDVKTFIEEADNDTNDDFTTEELAALNNADFVFRFLETDYEKLTNSTTQTIEYTSVVNIGILRLHFLSEGTTYNLGCVSDLVITDQEPEGDVSKGDNIFNILSVDFGVIFGLILLLFIMVAVAYLVVLLKPVIRFIGQGFKEIIGLIWSAITLPFYLLGRLFKGK